MSAVQLTAGQAPMSDRLRRPVRVMVVDDSVVIRGLVARWLDEEPGIEVVARCKDGAIAVEEAARLVPDVIILDIEMPVMDGLTALPKLLAVRPRPHVIVASTLTRRNAAITLKALSQGASECLPKPDSNSAITTSAAFRRELVAKTRALGGLDPTPGAARQSAVAKVGGLAVDGSAITLAPFNRTVPRVIAIGSSTGGPQALATVLRAAGSALASVPTIITQHMPATFTAILAENLSRATGRACKEADDGEIVQPGSVYIAPGGKHIVVERRGREFAIVHDDRPPVNFTKPSVDVMFTSLAAIASLPALAVVLTGMGHDGAAGAAAIRKAGGNVIAQDEASSVVWGMPGAAVHAGCCSAVMSLAEIGPKIARIIAGSFA